MSDKHNSSDIHEFFHAIREGLAIGLLIFLIAMAAYAAGWHHYNIFPQVVFLR
jgi:hypothetical protein